MGELYVGRPDLLFEQDDAHHAPEFILETFKCQKSDLDSIASKDAFRERVLSKIYTRKRRQDFLDYLIFRKSGTTLPAFTTAEERAEAVRKVLNNKKTKLRFIFSTWPRVLNAKPPLFRTITHDNSVLGKMAPNGIQFWGATAFDFYMVQKSHDRPELFSISTGSKLAKWAKENGETDGSAKCCIAWAADEKDPELILPYDIRLLIEDKERAIRGIECIINFQKNEEQSEGELDRWALPEQWPPKSVFEPQAYPKGWPTEAFSFYSTTNLQNYIPQHRLPEKLIVHDPSIVLPCPLYSTSERENTNRKVTYKLKLSEKYTDRRVADEDKEAEEKAHARKTLEAFLANPHSSLERPNGLEMIDLKEPGWTEPAVFVVFPPRPSFTRPDEAHLYLSRWHLIGKGNHSRVYNAEMVAPRSWLVPEEMCIECVKEDVKMILEQEDGPNGERRLKKWNEKTGMVVRHENKKQPVCVAKHREFGTVMYELREAVTETTMAYEGPYRVVHTRVEYQNLERGPLCVHASKGMAHLHPLATTVLLAAKLTIPQDVEMHQREAENYQRFPKHFFEHWSGFNVCWPMHEPVPVGPLVPQFYGYYVPEKKSSTYLSPILLIEKCGTQVTAKNLSIDDRNECLSQGLRMNAAGWYHGSFLERNILRQPGSLNESPIQKLTNGGQRAGYGVDWSFRMVDFGRSRHIEDLQRSNSESKLIDETNQIKYWWANRTWEWTYY